MTKTITATRFKAECLALLDEVAEAGESLIVTKRGLPVATIAPAKPPATLRGSVTFKVSDDELMAPLPERWDAELPDAALPDDELPDAELPDDELPDDELPDDEL